MKKEYFKQLRRVYSLYWFISDICAVRKGDNRERLGNPKFLKECIKESSGDINKKGLLNFYPDAVQNIIKAKRSNVNKYAGFLVDATENVPNELYNDFFLKLCARDDGNSYFDDVKKQLKDKLHTYFSHKDIEIIAQEIVDKRFFGEKLIYYRKQIDDSEVTHGCKERKYRDSLQLYLIDGNFFDLISIKEEGLSEPVLLQITECNSKEQEFRDILDGKIFIFDGDEYVDYKKDELGYIEDLLNDDIQLSQEERNNWIKKSEKIKKILDLSSDAKEDEAELDSKSINDSKLLVEKVDKGLYESLRDVLNTMIKNKGFYKSHIKQNELGILVVSKEKFRQGLSLYADNEFEKAFKWVLEKDKLEAVTCTVLFAMIIPFLNRENDKKDQKNEDENINNEEQKQLLYKIFYEPYLAMQKKNNSINKVDGKEDYDIGKLVSEIVFSYQFADYSMTNVGFIKLFKKNEDFYKSDSELCYLNYILLNVMNELKEVCTDGSLSYRFLSLNKNLLLENCFEYKRRNLNDNASEKYNGMNEYLSAALLEYAKLIINERMQEKYPQIGEILSYCDRTPEVELFEGDLYLEGIKDTIDGGKNYSLAYHHYCLAYASSQNNSIIHSKIIPCLEKMIGKTKNALTDREVRELIDFWLVVNAQNGDQKAIRSALYQEMQEKLSLKIQELTLEIKKWEQIQFFNETYSPQTAYKSLTEQDENWDRAGKPEMSYGNTYVIFGAGKATRAFMKTVPMENAKFFIVLQEHEIEREKTYRSVYFRRNVEIIETGYDSIFERLELYNLDQEFTKRKEVFKEFVRGKLHFLAIGDDLSENLAAIVSVIKRSWYQQNMYDGLCKWAKTLGIETGSPIQLNKLVQIKLSADTDIAGWYLDSLMSRYQDDFYMPISYVVYEKQAVKQLLTEYPLFLTDLEAGADENYIPKYNIVILGNNEIVLDILKGILSVSIFQRADLVDDEIMRDILNKFYQPFEDTLCKDFSITVISSDVEKISDRLVREVPDLDPEVERSYVHCKVKFVDLDINSSRFAKLFTAQPHGKDEDVFECLRKANYFICAADSDAESIKLGMRIRQMSYRSDKSMHRKPVISVLVKDASLDTNINEFQVENQIGSGIYADDWNLNYKINMFGKYEWCFSYGNLYNNVIDKIAREVHIAGKEGNKRERKVKDYYRNAYNRLAADYRAYYMPYLFYSVLAAEMKVDCALVCLNSDIAAEKHAKGRHWSIETFAESLERYIKLYNDKLGIGKSEQNEILIEILSIMEHNRWIMSMLMEGYTSIAPGCKESMALRKEYLRGWLDAGCGDNKLFIGKMHSAIIPYEKIGEKDDENGETLEAILTQLYNEKSERFDKKPSGKNRQYNREFVENIGTVMEEVRILEKKEKIKRKNMIHTSIRDLEVSDSRSRLKESGEGGKGR